MKTITQFDTLSFGNLLGGELGASFGNPLGASLRRQLRKICKPRTRLRAALITLPLLYASAGLKITADTGLAIWDWQFWLMFVPLFLLGERLIWMLRRESLARA